VIERESLRLRLEVNNGVKEAEAEIVEPRMITLVVPSPHSSSWVLLSSIMFFAAGWATSISRKIAFPSFVSLSDWVETATKDISTYEQIVVRKKSVECATGPKVQGMKRDKTGTYKIPPIGSRIIFSIAFGPRHVLITSATVYPVDVNRKPKR
jgi:hypothetical protein